MAAEPSGVEAEASGGPAPLPAFARQPLPVDGASSQALDELYACVARLRHATEQVQLDGRAPFPAALRSELLDDGLSQLLASLEAATARGGLTRVALLQRVAPQLGLTAVLGLLVALPSGDDAGPVLSSVTTPASARRGRRLGATPPATDHVNGGAAPVGGASDRWLLLAALARLVIIPSPAAAVASSSTSPPPVMVASCITAGALALFSLSSPPETMGGNVRPGSAAVMLRQAALCLLSTAVAMSDHGIDISQALTAGVGPTSRAAAGHEVQGTCYTAGTHAGAVAAVITSPAGGAVASLLSYLAREAAVIGGTPPLALWGEYVRTILALLPIVGREDDDAAACHVATLTTTDADAVAGRPARRPKPPQRVAPLCVGAMARLLRTPALLQPPAGPRLLSALFTASSSHGGGVPAAVAASRDVVATDNDPGFTTHNCTYTLLRGLCSKATTPLAPPAARAARAGALSSCLTRFATAVCVTPTATAPISASPEPVADVAESTAALAVFMAAVTDTWGRGRHAGVESPRHDALCAPRAITKLAVTATSALNTCRDWARRVRRVARAVAAAKPGMVDDDGGGCDDRPTPVDDAGVACPSPAAGGSVFDDLEPSDASGSGGGDSSNGRRKRKPRAYFARPADATPAAGTNGGDGHAAMDYPAPASLARHGGGLFSTGGDVTVTAGDGSDAGDVEATSTESSSTESGDDGSDGSDDSDDSDGSEGGMPWPNDGTNNHGLLRAAAGAVLAGCRLAAASRAMLAAVALPGEAAPSPGDGKGTTHTSPPPDSWAGPMTAETTAALAAAAAMMTAEATRVRHAPVPPHDTGAARGLASVLWRLQSDIARVAVGEAAASGEAEEDPGVEGGPPGSAGEQDTSDDDDDDDDDDGGGSDDGGGAKRRRVIRPSGNPYIDAARAGEGGGAGADDLADFVVCKPGRDYGRLLRGGRSLLSRYLGGQWGSRSNQPAPALAEAARAAAAAESAATARPPQHAGAAGAPKKRLVVVPTPIAPGAPRS